MSTAPAAPLAAPLSEPARIVDTFVAPTKTFADLKRSAAWWAPFILVAIASYVLVGVAAQKIGWDQIVENQTRLSPKRAAQIESLPAEQRARVVAQTVTVTKIISYGFPLVNLALLAAIAAVLMASFNFGAGAEISYKLSLAVVMYASLPGILKALLAAGSILAGLNPETFNFQNPVGTNPGYFMDPTASPALYALASGVDVIMLWTLALTATGFSAVSKLKRGTTFAVVFGWYVLLLLARAGFTAAFA
jgi:hypothetical protein